MSSVLYPGSFDPIHNGHRELIETASYLFDRVVVASIRNLQKSDGLFNLEERQAMIRESLEHLDNVEVVSMAKLTVDVAKENGCDFIIKGLRAVTDFDSEMAQAQMNLTISGMHTLFIPSGSNSSFIQSKFVRDVARFGGDLSALVPAPVETMLKLKFGA
ncbi:MAG: pantetheine-phosphate adenylyltransferase [Acidobacteria bacterium]|nr:pantetheine-phosphate adenylyltransferase [Acidobacteriota bacterium]